jgi:hypothetical protein
VSLKLLTHVARHPSLKLLTFIKDSLHNECAKAVASTQFTYSGISLVDGNVREDTVTSIDSAIFNALQQYQQWIDTGFKKANVLPKLYEALAHYIYKDSQSEDSQFTDLGAFASCWLAENFSEEELTIPLTKFRSNLYPEAADRMLSDWNTVLDNSPGASWKSNPLDVVQKVIFPVYARNNGSHAPSNNEVASICQSIEEKIRKVYEYTMDLSGGSSSFIVTGLIQKNNAQVTNLPTFQVVQDQSIPQKSSVKNNSNEKKKVVINPPGNKRPQGRYNNNRHRGRK